MPKPTKSAGFAIRCPHCGEIGDETNRVVLIDVTDLSMQCDSCGNDITRTHLIERSEELVKLIAEIERFLRWLDSAATAV